MKININLKVISLILTMFILMASFSFSFFWSNEEEEVPGIFNFKLKINKEVNVEKWASEETGIKEADGITFLDDCIYVTDKESDTIVVLDKEGNFQKQSSENILFLIEPTIIKTDGKSLYVIDSGNNQLKIISRDFDLIKCINLPVIDNGSDYCDLEIINEIIYLSCQTPSKEDAIILKMDENGSINKIGKEFIGYLSNFNSELMAVNSLEFYEGKTEKGLKEEGGKSGKNFMYKVSNDELKPKFEYVSEFLPLDFLLMNDFIYVFSAAFASLDKYTMDGQYVETLLRLDNSDLFVQLGSFDNSILIAYPTEKAIYKVNLD